MVLEESLAGYVSQMPRNEDWELDLRASQSQTAVVPYLEVHGRFERGTSKLAVHGSQSSGRNATLCGHPPVSGLIRPTPLILNGAHTRGVYIPLALQGSICLTCIATYPPQLDLRGPAGSIISIECGKCCPDAVGFRSP